MCYITQSVSKLVFDENLNDCAWFCVEKLKKHIAETKKPKHLSKIQKQSQEIRKQIALLGAFKGPCTLP